jgi:hypothetical protein
MDVRDYPVDVRADYPQRSSRMWAVFTIFWIKWFALIPHWFCLIFLGIAQFVVAFVAQFVVAARGEYPEGMHRFVTGVLRWQTRVTAFFLNITDRYPPFTIDPVADYPVDVAAQRPEQQSRAYAVFTIVVEVLAIAGGIWLAVWLIGHADTLQSLSDSSSSSSTYSYRFNNFPSFGASGLVLRQLAAIPHIIVLAFVGIAAIVIWIVVQWVILFVARFPYGMWELETGYVRWYARVLAYTLGLVDGYPPFSMQPSIGGGEGALATAPPPPPPPMTGSWPQAPAPQPPAPQTPAAPPPPPGPPAPHVPETQAPAPQTTPPQPDPPATPAPPGSGT